MQTNAKKTIASNEAAAKKIQNQRKFKKYVNFKCKSKPAVKATNITDENGNLKKTTYARYYELTKHQQGE